MPRPTVDPQALADWVWSLGPEAAATCDQLEATLAVLQNTASGAIAASVERVREQAVAAVIDSFTTAGPTAPTPSITVQFADLLDETFKIQAAQVSLLTENRKQLLAGARQSADVLRDPTTRRRSLNPALWQRRTWSVVTADLRAYEPLANEYRKLGANGPTGLDRLLARTFEEACERVGAWATGGVRPRPDICRYQHRGDGCVYLFIRPDYACQFAERLHRVADEHNRTCFPDEKDLRYRWWFKAGVVTGEATFELQLMGGNEASGDAVVKAVRQCDAAQPGQIRICGSTRDGLDDELRSRFTGQPPAEGMHGLTIPPAYAWQVLGSAPDEFARSGRGGSRR